MNFSNKLFNYIFLIGTLFLHLSMARTPKSIVSRNAGVVKDRLQGKGYKLEPKQFQFVLSKGQIVRFVIKAPAYISKTAIGIADDGTVKKMKILIFKMNSKDDKEATLLDGLYDTEDYFLYEILEKAYYYLIEIRLIEAAKTESGSLVELFHGFSIPEKQVIKPFDYHTDEREKPTGKMQPPCAYPERHGNCTGGEEGYIHRLE
ncbi:MAG: hypothetical protein SFU98_01130 [Leptospiraceae bacterium]|nr:hypothetical protein [Leptospiraceae bacterium]